MDTFPLNSWAKVHLFEEPLVLDTAPNIPCFLVVIVSLKITNSVDDSLSLLT